MSLRDKIDEVDFQDAWLDHPLTHRKRNELQKKRASALAQLINATSVSTDPEVRAALAKFRELDLLVMDLGGVKFSEVK